MKQKDKAAWMAKNQRDNQEIEIKVGMEVKDSEGFKGVIVKVIKPSEDTDGTVYVWQSDKREYGGDNCEHYCYTNWHSFLRITHNPFKEEKPVEPSIKLKF